jgi:hypothetical protein
MTGIYKHFARAGIVFCMAVGLICAPRPALAEDSALYTVEGVAVDVTAKNAVEARTKALDEAQVKAYRQWLEKNLGAEKAAEYPDLDPVSVSAMVQDFEITKEQLSATRYKGLFTVRFRPSALRHMAPASSAPADAEATPDTAYSYTDPQADTADQTASTAPAGATLVLPFYQSNGRSVLWEGDNPLRAAWSRTPMTAETGMVLPLGDLTDIGTIKDDQPLTFDPAAMEKMLARYQSTQAAILIAAPNAVKGLDVNIYSFLPGEKPHFIRTIQIMPDGTPDPGLIYARAVEQSKPIIQASAKPSTIYPKPVAPAPVAMPAGPAQSYTGRVHFNSVQEWVKMKNTLDRLPGMRSVMIKTLSPRMAEVDMSFSGDPQLLSVAMGQAGMSLKPTENNAAYDVFGGVTRP